MSNEPQTLTEAILHFADPDVALKTMVDLRWPTGVCCPTCGRADVRFIATRRMWECKEVHPKKQFSAKIGTIFEDSPLGLDKWFTAIWMIANCKNGVSSYEIARALGVTQKSAWFMLHRIRLAMETGSFTRSGGEFEADETFIGGRSKNMSVKRRAKTITGSGVAGKEVVMGVLHRGTKRSPARRLRSMCRTARRLRFKAWCGPWPNQALPSIPTRCMSYATLAPDYVHQFVDHAIEYVRDNVHTNGMENFWSLFKRASREHIRQRRTGSFERLYV
jgi:transposase-like protein